MQLKYVLNIHPNHEFNIFNSRRTPQSFNIQIEDELKNFTNARFINIDHPNDVSFYASLCESSLKFVTPDSANLVFESLSTHGKTYLIQIESPNYKRWFGSKKIRSTMNSLVMSKQVGVVSLLAKKNKLKISKLKIHIWLTTSCGSRKDFICNSKISSWLIEKNLNLQEREK